MVALKGEQMSKIYLPKYFLETDEKLLSFVIDSYEIENLCKKIVNNGDIVCLFGGYGVGKDLWARMIRLYAEHYFGGATHEIQRFADPLRDEFALGGFSFRDIDILKRSPVRLCGNVDGFGITGLTMREALIKVAEGNKEKFGQDFYAKQVIEKIRNSDKKQIITDCRFEVENDALVNFAQETGKTIYRFNIPNDLPKLVVL